MMPARAGWLILINTLLISCNQQNESQVQKPLVKVYDRQLFAKDIPSDIIDRARGKDSIPLLKFYLNDWVKQQVLLQVAKEEISGLDQIEKKTEDYRNNLIIYEYQKRLLEKTLDTAVSIDEIKAYYEKNQKNFQLKQNVVRLRYVKLLNDAPDQGKARKWFLSDDASDRYKLLEYCNKNAANTFFDEDSWLSFDDLLKEIPLKNYDEEIFLSNNKFVELKDDEYVYWVYIISFRVRSGVSPFEFETDNIRNILINKRKVRLLEEMEESLLKDAKIKNAIEWYID